ncbi:hypothetical protein A1Q1_05981 [Trichosporon asahii var. asahii CBS 2479]|uniref:Uncharacterized protein n=1 Tax=Trichosporon asahii var. asahii (strain ATCC 90039 / CBS 2479 / JCM 2466 / KCTC 7840 / NBRC 103889/ NCYC 2677 / UAMH 7654) TaxID=1186058 RepID=J4U642_TRIAS|nr:hypothetical protein A1Q1_05981 [Trichosporon asahii var. asahii CBS 2479]EJT45535.1 hypothetical protein A1Q1_05981 [Trichosporon asahii var. asahii CBS 2479]
MFPPFQLPRPARNAHANLAKATPENAGTIAKRMALAKSVHPDSDWLRDGLFMAWRYRIEIPEFEDKVKVALKELNDHRALCKQHGMGKVDAGGFTLRSLEKSHQWAVDRLATQKEWSREADQRYVAAYVEEDYGRRKYPHLAKK